MHRNYSLVAAMLVIQVLVSSPAVAQGFVFDIGIPDSNFVLCESDGESWELYLPFPFGPIYPVGSIVWASLEQMNCDQIPVVDGICIGAFQANFDEGGCGCGGVLERPTELKLRYSPEAVVAAGVDESSLRLVVFAFQQWGVDVLGATLDVEANVFHAQETGYILGWRWYAIVGDPTTPVAPVTWGAVKSLWR